MISSFDMHVITPLLVHILFCLVDATVICEAFNGKVDVDMNEKKKMHFDEINNIIDNHVGKTAGNIIIFLVSFLMAFITFKYIKHFLLYIKGDKLK